MADLATEWRLFRPTFLGSSLAAWLLRVWDVDICEVLWKKCVATLPPNRTNVCPGLELALRYSCVLPGHRLGTALWCDVMQWNFILCHEIWWHDLWSYSDLSSALLSFAFHLLLQVAELFHMCWGKHFRMEHERLRERFVFMQNCKTHNVKLDALKCMNTEGSTVLCLYRTPHTTAAAFIPLRTTGARRINQIAV